VGSAALDARAPDAGDGVLPAGRGRLLSDRKLAAIAARLGATPAQAALAWLVRQGDVMAIPQSSDLAHVRDNRAAIGLALDAAASARWTRRSRAVRAVVAGRRVAACRGPGASSATGRDAPCAPAGRAR